MKIDAIRVYQVDLPLIEGRYTWAGGKHFVETFDSTIVEVISDDGRKGYGENTPLGSAYLPAFALGSRAGIAELAPHLLGQDPTAVGRINNLMDAMLNGHGYAKSAIDMACWDLLGQDCGKPICDLMGGRFGDSFKLYRAITMGSPEQMAENVAGYRKQGYSKFQLKVGGDPLQDIERIRAVRAILADDEILVADANTGWRVDDAARVVNGVRDVDVYIEQPCTSYEHSLATRRRTSLPFILDENIDSLQMLIRAHQDGAMDAINLKISKFGGLTKAKVARDVCIDLGIPMNIEDTWGSDFITAAIAHLSHSTPEELRFAATDFNAYVDVKTGSGLDDKQAGAAKAPESPGLGITPDFDVLGKPVLEVS
ncbi:MAG: mandelate racemase/muconate lactonizing enzyme family protein [Woeseiaceae bacterium]